jgi:hypothetical protein
MTVAELLSKADADEISEWMVYFDIEDPELGEWQRTAMVCATVTNIANAQGRGKMPERASIDDFMPQKEIKISTAKQQIATLKAFSKAAPSKE